MRTARLRDTRGRGRNGDGRFIVAESVAGARVDLAVFSQRRGDRPPIYLSMTVADAEALATLLAESIVEAKTPRP